MKKFKILTLIIFCASIVYSQNSQVPIYTNSPNWHYQMEHLEGNFYDIINSAHQQFIIPQDEPYEHENQEEDDEKLMELSRFYNFWKNRVDGTNGQSGSFSFAQQAYSNYITNPICPSENSNANWKYVGSNGDAKEVGNPSRKYQKMGIVVSIAQDPSNTDIVYAGSNTGGLFKTTNFSDIDPFWVCVTENTQQLPGMGISHILLNTLNGNQTIYIATALMFNSNYNGTIDLFRSTDGGNTWLNTSFSSIYYSGQIHENIRGLVKDAINPNIMYVLTKNNIYKSNDGFVNNITQVYNNPSEDFNVIEVDPNISGKFYVGGKSLFEFTNFGITATNLTSFLPIPSSSGVFDYKIFNIELHSSSIYVRYRTENFLTNTFRGYLSTASYSDISNWTNLLNNHSNMVSESVYKRSEIHGYNFEGRNQGQFSKNSTGNNFSSKTFYSQFMPNNTFTHADIRCISYKDISGEIILGTDGGILYSNDYGESWYNKNGTGFNAQQFWGIAISESNSNVILGGLQDSDHMCKSGNDWIISTNVCCDGYDAVVDPNNPTTGFTLGNSSIKKISNIGASTFGYSSNLPTCPGFDPDWQMYKKPIAIDNNSNFYTAYNDIYKYSVGGVWSAISNFSVAPYNKPSSKCQSFDLNPIDNNVIHAQFGGPTWGGSLQHLLYRTTDGGANWSDISSGLLFALYAPITDVICNPHNSNQIFVSFGGYNASDRIMFSDDAGVTWQNLSNGLPPFPVNTLQFQKGSDCIIYAGTDVGTFVFKKNSANGSINNGSWHCYNKNAPIGIVMDLEINYCANKLVASYYGRGVWESGIEPFEDIVISNNTIYSSPINITSNIIIESGRTLTVNEVVNMSKNSKIIVKRGATLIIDGTNAKISNGCETRWPGIQVWGNTNVPQNSANAAEFGKVIIRNGGTIENAETAITTMKIDDQGNWDWNYSGGIVQCFNANFINNGRDVAFLGYANHNALGNEMITQSYFTKTNFITSQNYNYKEFAAPKWHVTIDGSSGIRFKGCVFKNERTQVPADYTGPAHKWAGGGIYAINSQVFVDRYCANFAINCSNAVPCQFQNLYEGINVKGTLQSNASSRKLNCSYSTFTNNATNGISIWSQNNCNVIANSFVYDTDNLFGYTAQEGFYQIGTLIAGATGYRVEENNYQGNSNGSLMLAGIKIVNSGGAPNEIYRNTFTNLYYGATALGTNKNTKINSSGLGLQFLCLTHQDNKWDNAVTKKANEPGIALFQGNFYGPNYRTADNTFSNISGTACTDVFNFYNECEFINYVGSNNLQFSPTLYDCNSIYVSNNVASNTGCPSKINRHKKLNALEKQAVVNDFNTKTIELFNTNALLSVITDGGNTSQVIASIAQSQPAQTQQLVSSLMSLSPNVSIPVLLKVAHEDDKMSPALQMLVLLANTQGGKNQKIIDTLRNKQNPMDQAMIDYILDNRNSTSLKEKLESKVSTLISDKNYLALVLINDLTEDTIGVDPDSIMALTELMDGNEKYFVKIYNAISDNNFSLCDSIYNMLSDSIEDIYLKEDYESLAPIIELEKALKSSNRNYHQLDNLEIQNLRSLARNEYASTGTIMAQNILGNAVGDEFEPYLKFPEEKRERRSKPQQQQIPAPTGLEAAFFKLYPNPAKNQTNLSYVLLPGQKGVASISDSNGKVVYETVLSNDQNSLSIELSNLAPSTYFLNVIVDNIVKYKETLVLRK